MPGDGFVTLTSLLLHLGFGSVCPQTKIWIIQQLPCVSTTEAPHNCKAGLAVFSWLMKIIWKASEWPKQTKDTKLLIKAFQSALLWTKHLLLCLVVAVTPGMSNEQHFVHSVLFTEGSLTNQSGQIRDWIRSQCNWNAKVYFRPPIKTNNVCNLTKKHFRHIKNKKNISRCKCCIAGRQLWWRYPSK